MSDDGIPGPPRTKLRTTLRRLFSRALARLVITDFRANQGLLLSGAVAFYTLLSVVPLFAVLVVALSHIADLERSKDPPGTPWRT